MFAAGIFALGGLPPFGLFLSEILIVRAAWAAGHPSLTGLVLVLLLIAFGSLLVQVHRMLFGEALPGIVRGERASVPLVLLALPVAAPCVAWRVDPGSAADAADPRDDGGAAMIHHTEVRARRIHGRHADADW